MRDYTIPAKGLAMWLAPLAVLYGILAFTPPEWDFPIIGGYVLLSAVLWMGVLYRASGDEKAEKALEDFTDSKFWEARTKTFERIAPGGILLVMLMLQVIIAHNALSEEKQETLASAFSAGPVEIGVFQFVMFMIVGWMVGPTLSYFTTRGLKAIQTRWTR